MHDRTAGFGAKRPFIRGRGRGLNSLMFTKNSQLLEIFSLLFGVGKFVKTAATRRFLTPKPSAKPLKLQISL